MRRQTFSTLLLIGFTFMAVVCSPLAFAQDEDTGFEEKTPTEAEAVTKTGNISEKVDPEKAAKQALLVQAYDQLREGNNELAVNTLCAVIKQQENPHARRYLSYALLQERHPREAFQQLQAVSQPIGFDYYMRGVASDMLGQQSVALGWYCAAVDKEPTNYYFRRKALDSLIIASRYSDAQALCSDGINNTTDPSAKKFFIEQEKRAQRMKETLAKVIASH